MKSLKSLSLLTVIMALTILFTTSKCKCNKCSFPVITFDPAATSVSKEPGEHINLNITVTVESDNIKSIIVSRTADGTTNPTFISVTSIGSKTKTITLVDSVPYGASYNSSITYIVTAVSDCKEGSAMTKTFTVNILPSSGVLDPLFYFYENTQYPRQYSRYSTILSNNQAWELVGAPNLGTRFVVDPNSQKDIQDSLNNTTGNPFTPNARWGSRNGSKFVKAPSTFNYTTPSTKSIIEAYKAGVPSDLISVAVGDFIVVNIKNANRYAVCKIRYVLDDGMASNEDYVLFSYWLAP